MEIPVSKCYWLSRLVFVSVLQFEKSLTPDIEQKSLTVISKSFIFKARHAIVFVFAGLRQRKTGLKKKRVAIN